jgi:hypothetical protein
VSAEMRQGKRRIRMAMTFWNIEFILSANIFCCNVCFGSMEYELGRRKLDS